MMASPAAKGRARTLAGWLALAAAPTFALMSLIAANDMTASTTPN